MKKMKKKRGCVRRGAYRARGNMDVTAALIRCALACCAFLVLAGALSVFGLYALMPDWAAMLVQAALTLACFGVPAVYGLFYADGSQMEKIPHMALSAQQLRTLAMTGVLLVCPMTLLTDLINAPLLRLGLITQSGAGAPPFALFVPMLVKSVLLAPLCEELFFRGYLFTAFRASGSKGAMVICALFFALVHGVDTALAPRFLMGLLLGVLMLRTDSLLAPVIVHAAYNLTILAVSYAGLGGLFSGLGLVSCLVRVPLCAAFVYMLKEAYTARGARTALVFGHPLTPRQWLLLIAALAALIVCPLLVAA